MKKLHLDLHHMKIHDLEYKGKLVGCDNVMRWITIHDLLDSGEGQS